MPDQPYCTFCQRTDRLEVLAFGPVQPVLDVPTQFGTVLAGGTAEPVVAYRCGCGNSGRVGVSAAYVPPEGTPAL